MLLSLWKNWRWLSSQCVKFFDVNLIGAATRTSKWRKSAYKNGHQNIFSTDRWYRWFQADVRIAEIHTTSAELSCAVPTRQSNTDEPQSQQSQCRWFGHEGYLILIARVAHACIYVNRVHIVVCGIGVGIQLGQPALRSRIWQVRP